MERLPHYGKWVMEFLRRLSNFCVLVLEVFQLLSQLESEGRFTVPDPPWAESDKGADSGNLLGPASASSSPAAETLDVVQPLDLADGIAAPREVPRCFPSCSSVGRLRHREAGCSMEQSR